MKTENAAPKHILVVEDDIQHRLIVVRILENAGFHVTAAQGFAAAIEVIESDERLHVLLTDIKMPEGTPNGVTIARMAQVRRHKLPIVYMSGSYEPDTISALEPGVPTLAKPFTSRELIKVIEAVII
jgi:CheY-like chemotaxis protein